MIIYQDFLEAHDKQAFILGAIQSFKNSEGYRRAIKAQSYYQGNNTTINERLRWFIDSAGAKQRDKFRANNRISSEFFPKIVKQMVSYLTANGLTTDDEIKNAIGGRKFDVQLQNAGEYASVDGVAWGYCFIDDKGRFRTVMWRGTEVIPMYDERTGAVSGAIRFWQLENRPMYVTLYELEGYTEYKFNKGKGEQLTEKTPYKLVVNQDILGEEVVNGSNFSKLPLFPLFINSIHQSAFTKALESQIDLYDIITSDFGDNLEDNKDIVWLLKNYQGQDIGEFLSDLKEYGVIKTDSDGGAEAHQQEVPYNARQVALELLKKQIYEGSMSLDTSVLSGGSLTNVAIKANMQDLDLKTDDFENQLIDFVDNIIQLYLEHINQSNKEYKIEFIRRSLINDSEIVENIYKMRNDISHKTALKLNPYIEDVDLELDNLDEEAIANVTLSEPIDFDTEETEELL